MEQNILKTKRQHSRLISAISVGAIILLVLLNLLLTYVGMQKALFVDTTYEGLYTLTDLMKKECAFVDEELDGENKVTITFCADPDALIDYELTRVVYFMSLQLASTFENIEVKTINVNYNPTAVSKYKSTSLSDIVSGDIIISCGDRYRVVSCNNFWVSSSGTIIAYNGEYKMASLIKSVTAVDRPKAYFVVGHGEVYYDSANLDRAENVEAAYLQDLISDRGLESKTINLSEVDKIPDDCVLLIINNPKTDYIADMDRLDEFGYVSETEKIDRYLVENQGAVMVAKDYAITLPNLEDFLYEWGFDFSTTQVKVSAETDDGGVLIPQPEFIGKYDTDENSYGYAIYGNFASLSSAPSMFFTNTGYVSCSYGENYGTNEPGTFSVDKIYAPFFYSPDGTSTYDKNGGLEKIDTTVDLCAVTTRIQMDGYTSEKTYSYVFCSGSADFFSNDVLGNASFANYEIMSAFTENAIRSDEYASIDLGGTSANSINQGGKLLVDETIYSSDYYENDFLIFEGLTSKAIGTYVMLIMTVPLVIGIVGIAVRIRRRFL